MNQKTIRGMLLLFLAAWIWGAAFVAQSAGNDHMNAFAFNCIRNLIGFSVLLPFIFYRSHKSQATTNIEHPSSNNKGVLNKELLLGGLICGGFLFLASNFQQMGIAYSTVGKSAFITTLYIVLVPLLGIFLRKKVPFLTWIGVFLAMSGLYLLCMKDEAFVLGTGDIYLLLCALFFSFQILSVDYFAQRVDAIALSATQFLFCGIFSGIGMILTDIPSISDIWASAIPLLYAGAFSSGIAYTLQVVGQKDVPATIASLIMSLESVTATLAGWLILHEVLSMKELIGCGLVFAAVILAQLPSHKASSKE